MKAQTRSFKALTAKACQDTTLRATLRRASAHFTSHRDQTFAAFPEAEARRERAREAKHSALLRLPELLRRLEQTVTAAGGQVHWAADAAEARAVILAIAKDNGVSRVVKGKSMITEEIALNPALIEAGIEVWETDLGEYIIQLAGEGPSHIIAPAVHKSRAEVADLFAEKLGERGEEIPELTRIARRALRERFLDADMGVTGVNIAVAETGSLVLLENEGNIRMSTTCPRVHVAVMSLEKVVADFSDMDAILQILPRSATGQTLSSYVSVFTGPRREGERDGAATLHLVILDNGRSRILADPDFREVLRCLRCGACLNYCPVYQTVGGHAYGWMYSGPIGAILAPLLLPKGEAEDLPFACTLCGACAEVCPVGINHPKLLLALRQRMAEDPAWRGAGPEDTAPRADKGRRAAAFFAFLARRPRLFRAASAAARTFFPNPEALGRAPGFSGMRRFCRTRSLPRLKTPFSKRWPSLAASLAALAKNGK